jgi:hypothetical protein
MFYNNENPESLSFLSFILEWRDYMVAGLSKRGKIVGPVSGIDAEIEFTRLKIIYILKHGSGNYQTLRTALYRYSWLLVSRQFNRNFRSKEATRVFTTIEQFLGHILPVRPGDSEDSF